MAITVFMKMKCYDRGTMQMKWFEDAEFAWNMRLLILQKPLYFNITFSNGTYKTINFYLRQANEE